MRTFVTQNHANGHIVKTIDFVAKQNVVQVSSGVYTGIASDGRGAKSFRIVVR